MADLRTIARDSDFQSLPMEEKIKAFSEYDKDFALLPESEKIKGISELSGGEKPQAKQYTFGEAVKSAPVGLYGGVKEYLRTLVSPETYKSLGGLLGKLTSADPEERRRTGKELLSGLWEKGKESYGGWENIKRTIAERPLDPVMDAAALLTGGGAGISRIPQLARAGEIMGTVGRAIEPGTIMGKPLGWAYQGAKKAITGPLGVSTGMGASGGAAGKMVEGSKTFKEAMRGKISGEEIVEKAKGGLHQIAEERGDRYRAALTDIENMPNAPRFALTSVSSEFDRQLNNFKISKITDPKTGEWVGLDFGRSAILANQPAINDFNNIFKVIKNAQGDAAFYSTPLGYDHLKRQLAGMYKETSQGRAAVEATSNVVRTELGSRVPGYTEMTKDYAKTTKMIDEIERDLSIGDKKSVDTALRKFNATMREDDEFRRSMMAHVEKASGENLQAMISGRLAESWMPKSWMGREFAIGSLFSGLLGHPKMLAGLALASPRLMGETFSLLNLTEKGIKASGITRPEVRMGIMQGERLLKSRGEGSEQNIGITSTPTVSKPVQLDEKTATGILIEAGGNKDRAREIARQKGYQF